MIKSWNSRNYFNCDCGTETLACEVFDEERQFYFSFWAHGRGSWKFSWMDRFKAVWYILTKGHPYTDGIILNREDAVELATTILEKQKDWHA